MIIKEMNIKRITVEHTMIKIITPSFSLGRLFDELAIIKIKALICIIT